MAAQALAHLARQRAHDGLADICHLDVRRVDAVARTHAGGHFQSALVAFGNQGFLAGQRVDAVDHVIAVARHQLVDVLAGEKAAQHRHLAIGVDVRDARTHQFGLGLPDGGKQGGQLAVDVADGHHIVIEQGQPPDPGARQRFSAVGTDSAHAGDEDMLAGESADTFAADEDVGAGELGRDSVWHGAIINAMVLMQVTP
jgi:hypothetical protein